MSLWKIVYTPLAQKDIRKLKQSPLWEKAQRLLHMVSQDPYTVPPPYKNLVGDLKGALSRRLNIQHRLVYQVYEKEHTVKVIRLWSHYD